MNQTADLAIVDLACPIVGPFFAQQSKDCQTRVLPTVAAMPAGDSVVALRRLLYLLEVTTGFVVIAGCKSGSLPRVSKGLVSMRSAMRSLKDAPTCFTPDFDALGVLAVETGRLFAVCIEAVTLKGETAESALDLCLSVFETVAAIE